ncbi:hypothetical protein QFC22_005666 [Naganishia vaughanmartiniae]|uniref:Uncharacterized protein n=1 Tax=Naganishia vaughanmartiniae TaxID=1424756 RepID=A0ACC2WSS0_9TREE|nr:hypothetical protein QFC22_005666 [Naganishia vaughanmartiniae]
MPQRVSLASATQAFNVIYNRLYAAAIANPTTSASDLLHSSPDSEYRFHFSQLQHLLDLFAHIERIDDKLYRSAYRLLSGDIDGLGKLGDEESKVVERYARVGPERRKKRRMLYVGWSLMLRRAYLNSILISAVERYDTKRFPPPFHIEAQVVDTFDAIIPYYGSQQYKQAEHLFVRNIQDEELVYIRRTIEKWREVMQLFDAGKGWNPSLLPKAKPIAEILKGMQTFVESVTRTQKDLQKIVASLESRQSRHKQRERQLSVMTDSELASEGRQRQRSASLRPSMNTFLRTSSRTDEGGSSRSRAVSVASSRAESRGPSLAPHSAIRNASITGEKTKRRPRMSLPARLASPSITTPTTNTTTSLRLPARADSQNPNEREPGFVNRAVLQYFADPAERQVEGGNVKGLGDSLIMQERGRAGVEKLVGVALNVDKPPPPGGIPQPRTTPTTTPPPAQQDATHQISGQIATPIRAAAAPTATPAGPDVRPVREGAVFVPSPGMKFEIDAQGRLVYVGGGLEPAVNITTPVPTSTSTSGTRPLTTPQSLAASREKVAKAAEATRSPVPLAIIRSRASIGGGRITNAGGWERFATPDTPMDKGKRRYSESVRPGGEEERVEGRKKQRVSEGVVARPDPQDIVRTGAPPTTSVIVAIEPNQRAQSERRSSRPATFEDFEIERLPPRRRGRRTSGTAVAFSRAMRDAED